MYRPKSAKLISGLGIVCLILWLLLPASCAPAPTAKSPTPTLAPGPAPASASTPAPAPKPPPTPSPTSPWPKVISVGTLGTGSAYYPVIVGASKMISKYAGVTADPAVHSTMAIFPKRLQEEKLDLGLLNTMDSHDSMRGLNTWKGDANTAHRFVISISVSGTMTFATRSSGIKTMSDIVGKKYMCDYAGSATSKIVFGAIRDAYGLTNDKITVITYSAMAEIADAIKEGRADAAIYYVAKQTPVIAEMATNKDLNYISLEESKVKEICAKAPVVPYSIPAGSYKGQDEPWKGVGVLQTIVARVTLPDDLVYAIVSAIYDHFDEYSSFAPTIAESKLPDGLNPLYFVVPVHAGAIKYYKEKGWWTTAHQERQDALLRELKLQK